jgi:hypothetical protein
VDNFIHKNLVVFELDQKTLKMLRVPNLRLFFLTRQWFLKPNQFSDFSLNKNFKTYPGLMLPLVVKMAADLCLGS